jgi:hypothetical protein
MARTKTNGRETAPTDDDRHRTDPAGGDPRDLVVEEERLPDGRYVLYYAWPRPDTDPGGRPDATRRGAGGGIDGR